MCKQVLIAMQTMVKFYSDEQCTRTFCGLRKSDRDKIEAVILKDHWHIVDQVRTKTLLRKKSAPEHMPDILASHHVHGVSVIYSK
jgi:hypothetical protein